MREQTLVQRIKARRTNGGEPCPEYVPKKPEDYGYGSCKRCGWAEPEHCIDQLLGAVTTLTARCEALEQANARQQSLFNDLFLLCTADYETVVTRFAESRLRDDSNRVNYMAELLADVATTEGAPE